MKRRKICIITGSRAEWGLFYPLAREIRKNKKGFHLQIIVTGMHLSPEYGSTYKEIESDGFKITRKVDMLVSGDTEESVSKSIGLGIIGLTDALREVQPELVILLGDRFETFSAAIASYMLKIPIVHIHGGELTEAAMDDALRHSISKMASLHFVSTLAYKKRVVQIGELPGQVFNVGSLGLDSIKNTKLLTKETLEEKLKFKLGRKNILITFHPVTHGDRASSDKEFRNLLKSVDEIENARVILTKPNSDMYSNTIINMIESYVSRNEDKATCFTSMGRLLYLNAVRFVDVVAGNSSSGIIEVPSFGVPTVNIGDRQKGRVRSHSIIDCNGSIRSINIAFKKAFSESFRKLCKKTKNPYDNGNASENIVSVLKKAKFLRTQKKFYDINFKM